MKNTIIRIWRWFLAQIRSDIRALCMDRRQGDIGKVERGAKMVISRRSLIGAGVAAATSAAIFGTAIAPASAHATEHAYAKMESDVTDLNRMECGVLVIGGGGAGIAAAISASEHGAEVTLLEKTGILGGATILSSGKMPAAGTMLQEERDIKDTVWALANDILRPSNHSVREELVYTAASAAKDVIDWTAGMGVNWTLDDSLYFGRTNYRMHTADGAGNGLTTAMIDRMESIDAITALTDTEALGLIGMKKTRC